MRIVSYHHYIKLWILSDGNAISVDAHPEFRVGQELQCVDGVYTLATDGESCET